MKPSMKPNIWMGHISQALIAKNHLQVNVRQKEPTALTESAKYLLARNRDNN